MNENWTKKEDKISCLVRINASANLVKELLRRIRKLSNYYPWNDISFFNNLQKTKHFAFIFCVAVWSEQRGTRHCMSFFCTLQSCKIVISYVMFPLTHNRTSHSNAIFLIRLAMYAYQHWFLNFFKTETLFDLFLKIK